MPRPLTVQQVVNDRFFGTPIHLVWDRCDDYEYDEYDHCLMVLTRSETYKFIVRFYLTSGPDLYEYQGPVTRNTWAEALSLMQESPAARGDWKAAGYDREPRPNWDPLIRSLTYEFADSLGEHRAHI